MKPYARIRTLLLTAFAGAGVTTPAAGWAHWEGFEAADPTTPAAVLTFDSAIGRYTSADAGPRRWRTLFEVERDSGTAAGAASGAHTHHPVHTGATPPAPATTRQ